MRSNTGVFIGNLLFIAVCCSAAPFFLLVGYSAWSDYPGRDWPAVMFVAGLAGTVMIPVLAITATRQEFPDHAQAPGEGREPPMPGRHLRDVGAPVRTGPGAGAVGAGGRTGGIAGPV